MKRLDPEQHWIRLTVAARSAAPKPTALSGAFLGRKSGAFSAQNIQLRFLNCFFFLATLFAHIRFRPETRTVTIGLSAALARDRFSPWLTFR